MVLSKEYEELEERVRPPPHVRPLKEARVAEKQQSQTGAKPPSRRQPPSARPPSSPPAPPPREASPSAEPPSSRGARAERDLARARELREQALKAKERRGAELRWEAAGMPPPPSPEVAVGDPSVDARPHLAGDLPKRARQALPPARHRPPPPSRSPHC